MVIRLIPFNSSDNFKHIKKMAMIDVTTQQQRGFGSTPINYNFPTTGAPQAEKTQFYNDYLQNVALQSELQKPIEEKIVSKLSQEMIDILQNPSKSDDARVYDYMNAIKRYLYYRNRAYNLAPVAAVNRKRVRIQDSQGISPQHKYTPPKKKAKAGKRNRLFLDRDDVFSSDGEAVGPPGAPGGDSPRRARGESIINDEDDFKSIESKSNFGDDDDDDDDAGLDLGAYNVSDDGDGIDEDLINKDRQRALKVEDIVESVHPSLKPKVKLLLKKILEKVDRKELGWNENNEVIINGTVTQGVSFSNLLQNVVAKERSRKPGLNGFPDLVNILLSNNIISDKLGDELLQVGKGGRIRNWEL
jgi:hypothetical protein